MNSSSNDAALRSRVSSPKEVVRVFRAKLLRAKLQAKEVISNPHSKYVISVILFAPLQIIFSFMYFVFFAIQGAKEWEYRTKPAPMIFVILTAVAFMLNYGLNRFRLLILSGLTFSLLGDIILMGEGEGYFLAGLGTFLIAHVMYIIAFSIPPTDGSPRVSIHPIRGIPFILLGGVIPIVITDKLVQHPQPDTVLIGAIFVYGIVLSLMGWRVAARIGYPLEPTASQVAALIGAMFFILSDCILAFNKFHTKVHLAQVWVLGCYWLGQTIISFFSQKFPWDSFEKPRSTSGLVRVGSSSTLEDKKSI